MADLQTILKDPDFRASSPETKREILQANDADFAKSTRATQDEILGSLGGAPARPKAPESGLELMARGLTRSGLGTSYSGVADVLEQGEERFKHLYTGAGQFGGSTAGAIAGQKVAGRPGAVLGAGLGGGAGRLLDVYRAHVSGEILPESLVKDALKAAGISMAFEAGGQLALAGAGKLVKKFEWPPRADAAEVFESFRATGVTPKITDITGSRWPAVLERAAAQTVTGQERISERVMLQGRQLATAADEYFLQRLATQPATESVEAGLRVQRAVEVSVERSRGVENRLFEAVERLGDKVTIPIDQAKAAAQQLLDKEMLRPAAQRHGTLIATLKEVLAVGAPKTVDTGLLDIAGQKITSTVATPAAVPLKKARVWAQTFGEAVERGELISRTPAGSAKFMFAQLMDDIERGIGASGKADLQQAFAAAREFATLRREIFVDSAVRHVMQTPPEHVVQVIGAAGGPTAIRNAKQAIFGPEGAIAPDPRATATWNLVRRHIFEGIFAKSSVQMQGTLGKTISGAGLERELKRLGPESLNELLAGTERAALDNVLTVAKAIRSGETLASAAQSTTAQQLMAHEMFRLPGYAVGSVVGASLGAAGFGSFGAAAGAGIGAAIGSKISMLFTPARVAKMLTDERAVAELASPAFRRLATDLRLGGPLSREAMLALERLGATFVTDAAADRAAAPARR